MLIEGKAWEWRDQWKVGGGFALRQVFMWEWEDGQGQDILLKWKKALKQPTPPK